MYFSFLHWLANCESNHFDHFNSLANMWPTTAKYRKNTTTKVLQNSHILWSLSKYIAKVEKNIPISWQKCEGNFLMWSENKVPVLNQNLYPVLGCTRICSHYLNIHLNHAWHYGTTWLNPYQMQQPTSWTSETQIRLCTLDRTCTNIHASQDLQYPTKEFKIKS
jgi:hypothetical protein